MLTVPHTLVGAAIGTLVEGAAGAPALAFGLGWVSHYALDTIPHWERLYRPHDIINWDTKRPVKEWPRHIFLQAVADVLIAAGIIFVVWQLDPSRNTAVLWGALGGALPDLLDNVPFLNKVVGTIPGFRSFQRFHNHVHISERKQRQCSRYTGLLTQLATIAIAAAIIAA